MRFETTSVYIWGESESDEARNEDGNKFVKERGWVRLFKRKQKRFSVLKCFVWQLKISVHFQ